MTGEDEYSVTGTIEVTFRDDKLLRSYLKREAAHKHFMTTTFAHGMRPGDRITMPCDSNRVRRRVVDVGSATHFETATHIRPSRGYAKHVRRTKTKRRK